MTQALQGVQVLDLSRFLPGPFCSGVLADFGADVVRVEEPGWGAWGGKSAGHRGDQARGVTRGYLDEVDMGQLRAFDCVSRNKRSIVLNLKSVKGKEVIHRLVQWADVLIEEFRPGVTKRLGVDYETCRSINPRIIYCSITLYGQDGPYRDYPGHDPCALGVAGVLGLSALEHPPTFFAVPVADILSGSQAVIGILCALRARDLTGRGQHIDVSMTDSALSTLCLLSQPHFQGKSIPRAGRKTPWAYVWQTKDGKYFCTTNVEPHHWVNFCRAIGRGDMVSHFLDPTTREEMCEQVKKVFLTRTRDEWIDVLRKADTQVAPVYESLAEVFADPQVRHRGMVLEFEHPRLGKVKHLGFPIKLSGTPAKVRRLAPVPGQNTNEVLGELGYTPEQVTELRQARAVM